MSSQAGGLRRGPQGPDPAQAAGLRLHGPDEALWEEAQLEYETGRFASCGRILDRLLAKGKTKVPGVPGEGHLLKARLALRDGNLPAAQGSILEARAANPYDPKVYTLARQAFARPEDMDRLSEMMRDALDLMPGSAPFTRYPQVPTTRRQGSSRRRSSDGRLFFRRFAFRRLAGCCWCPDRTGA